MAYTDHYNLPEMPTGAVDWPAIINAIVAKLEQGRTYRLTAGESLAKGDPVYLHTDSKAYKAVDTDPCRGVWQSTTTALGAEGFMQADGYLAFGGGWTIGADFYVSAAGALTQTVGTAAVGYALSATEIIIKL
jgi:hypothetical protein